MKKILVIACCCIAPLDLMAYYGSYSSPEIEIPGWIIFWSMIMIVWGILEIILFFKLWRMTNDVHNIANRILGISSNLEKKEAQERPKNIKIESLYEKDGSTQSIIKNEFIDKCLGAYNYHLTNNSLNKYEKDINVFVKRYEGKAKENGVSMDLDLIGKSILDILTNTTNTNATEKSS